MVSMKINGIEVQGIRRVHIEDLCGNAEKVWNRIEFTGKGGFYWRYHIREGLGEIKESDLVVADDKILDLIRWVFIPSAGYNARIKGDTVYAKVVSQQGRAWRWGYNDQI